MDKTMLIIMALALASTQVQAASGKHMMRKAGGEQHALREHGSGGGAGKVRIQAHRPPNVHMLNPQPLPPG